MSCDSGPVRSSVRNNKWLCFLASVAVLGVFLAIHVYVSFQREVRSIEGNYEIAFESRSSSVPMRVELAWQRTWSSNDVADYPANWELARIWVDSRPPARFDLEVDLYDLRVTQDARIDAAGPTESPPFSAEWLAEWHRDRRGEAESDEIIDALNTVVAIVRTAGDPRTQMANELDEDIGLIATDETCRDGPRPEQRDITRYVDMSRVAKVQSEYNWTHENVVRGQRPRTWAQVAEFIGRQVLLLCIFAAGVLTASTLSQLLGYRATM